MTISKIIEKKSLIGKKHRLILKGREIPKNPCIRCYNEKLEDTHEIQVTSITRINSNRVDVFLNVNKPGNYIIAVDQEVVRIWVENDKPKFWWILIPLIPALIVLFFYLIYAIGG